MHVEQMHANTDVTHFFLLQQFFVCQNFHLVVWRSEIIKLKPERPGNPKREHSIKFEIEQSGRAESIRESCFTDDKPHLKALFQTESKLKLRLRRRIHTRESPLHYTSSSICNAMQQYSDERRRQPKVNFSTENYFLQEFTVICGHPHLRL